MVAGIVLSALPLAILVVNGCGAAILAPAGLLPRPPESANGLGCGLDLRWHFFCFGRFCALGLGHASASHASPTKVHNTDRVHTLSDMTTSVPKEVNSPMPENRT